METDVSQDLQDYWNEYKIIQETKLLDEYLDELDDYGSPASCDEGEQEADWLRAAGLPQLTEPYMQNREVSESDLDPALQYLSPHQADAVRRRVQTLNRTVRQKARQQRGRQRKPDIRDVFRDAEISSTGTRSRSATPDSLDSELPCEETGPPSPPWPLSRSTQSHQPRPGMQDWSGHAGSTTRIYIQSQPSPPAVQVFHHERNGLVTPVPTESMYTKEPVRRLPSAPHSHQTDFFRHTGAWGGNKKSNLGGHVASDSEGIQMLNYQQIGTVHLPRPRERVRSGSDPNSPIKHSSPSHIGSHLSDRNKLRASDLQVALSRSHSNLFNVHEYEASSSIHQRATTRVTLRRTSSQGHLGFEEMCRRNQHNRQPNHQPSKTRPSSAYGDRSLVGRTWVEYLGEADLLNLQPLLLLEVTALFEHCNITFHKRKSPKRKRKEDGNVFGVSLKMLLERDKQMTVEICPIPLVFQKLLSYLERHGVREEGILRVAGLKQKVDSLRAELERDFYSRPEEVERLLQHASNHDVAAVLKRLLRDLPQPLLTPEYIDMFYQAHALPHEAIRARALNLLTLLLPSENRNVLRAIFKFLNSVTKNQAHNKMSMHNVAMIIAPSLFNPCYMMPAQKSDLTAQVNMAAICCRLTESMLQCGDSLWVVPAELITQVRHHNEEERYKRGTKENNKPIKRFLGKKAGVREPITRKIENEVDFQEGILRVNAPQFQMKDFPVQLFENMTAGDVVLRVVEEAARRSDIAGAGLKVSRHRHSRALAELAPNGNLSCILATSYPLETHFLYEVGGNIAQRQIEHGANLLAIYKENPNTQWTLRCHHRKTNDVVPLT